MIPDGDEGTAYLFPTAEILEGVGKTVGLALLVVFTDFVLVKKRLKMMRILTIATTIPAMRYFLYKDRFILGMVCTDLT